MTEGRHTKWPLDRFSWWCETWNNVNDWRVNWTQEKVCRKLADRSDWPESLAQLVTDGGLTTDRQLVMWNLCTWLKSKLKSWCVQRTCRQIWLTRKPGATGDWRSPHNWHHIVSVHDVKPGAVCTTEQNDKGTLWEKAGDHQTLEHMVLDMDQRMTQALWQPDTRDTESLTGKLEQLMTVHDWCKESMKRCTDCDKCFVL